MTAIASTALLLTVVALTLAGSTVSSGLQLPGFPNQSVQSTLFSTGSDRGEGGATSYFNVSGPTNAGGLTEVGISVAVNVSCGGPTPYLIGMDFQCKLTLQSFSGPGGDTLVWSATYNGSADAIVTPLASGSYTLVVSVAGGSAPDLVILVPFSWEAVGVTLVAVPNAPA